MQGKSTYVSLFSGGGLGCFGLKQAGFDCVATSELLPRRLEVQKANNFVDSDDGYILGDITKPEVQDRLYQRVATWQSRNPKEELTLVLATPPCQGMSVANHKKNDELSRNSLVVESIRFIGGLNPKFFVMENVRSFLTTLCTDLDGVSKPISEAIDVNLSAQYNIASRVMNFKEHGADSSRTRTLVVGVRRDLTDTTPWSFFPQAHSGKTLRDLIGHLPPLNEMGEISKDDIFHAFKPYEQRMRPWIQGLEPGQSAFENIDPKKRPHRLVDGELIENRAANGDKYRRNLWDKVAPCVHTRNDILASQSTVHPIDDRVFSIRELSLMMGLNHDFKWAPFDNEELNNLPMASKQQFLREHEINIRQCLGEGVPAPITRSIGVQITEYLAGLGESNRASKFIRDFEVSNPARRQNAAFYTRLDIAGHIVATLPEFASKKTIRILEPSVGVGSFLLPIVQKYRGKRLELDLVDIDGDSLAAAKEFILKFCDHPNLTVRFFQQDYLTFMPDQKYDLVVGNPPFGKPKANQIPLTWSTGLECKDLFARFIERALSQASIVALLVPKTLLSAPEHLKLREHLANLQVTRIDDFGEKAFSDIKIETIGIVVKTDAVERHQKVKTVSYALGLVALNPQSYICDPGLPTWLLYRNKFFDEVAANLDFDSFTVVRDREITSKDLSDVGTIQVVQAANIPRNGHTVKATRYLAGDVLPAAAKSYIEKDNCLVAPNLSYYPRVARLKRGQVVDGSAAVLIPRGNGNLPSSATEFFSSDVFFYFYRIARNYSTRSLNIDSSSVFYWALLKPESKVTYNKHFEANSSLIFQRPKELGALQAL